MSSSTTIRTLCVAMSFAGLASCSDAPVSQFAPPCPQVGVLRDAADLTVFNGAGTDLTDLVIDGRITGLTGKCALDDAKHLRAQLTMALDLTRGPASGSRTVDVDYFLAATRGSVILDRKPFRLRAEFTGNADTIRLTTDEIDFVFPVDDKTPGDAYSILAAFQLTPQQLDFNRRRGVR